MNAHEYLDSKGKIPFNQKMWAKIDSVINSCETEPQFKIAKRFLELATERMCDKVNCLQHSHEIRTKACTVHNIISGKAYDLTKDRGRRAN